MDAFRSLLRVIVALEKFSYQHCGVAVGGELYEPCHIVAALRENAAHSLEYLHLEAEQGCLHYIEHVQHIGSLQAFKPLKSVRLQDKVFETLESSVKRYSRTEPRRDSRSNGAEDVHDQRCLMARLVDLLPATTESVYLIQLLRNKDISHMLEGLAEGKKDEVPCLERAMIEGLGALEEDITISLEGAGIKT
ncbi:MAG: hypothetical protein Q9181_007765 [Wetmoreana brouardii]